MIAHVLIAATVAGSHVVSFRDRLTPYPFKLAHRPVSCRVYERVDDATGYQLEVGYKTLCREPHNRRPGLSG